MKNKKGITTQWTVILIVVILAISGLAVWGVQAYNTSALSVIGEDADGEFDDVILPEDTIGTDLVANTSYAEDTSDVFTATFETDLDLNGTDGNTYVLAFQFEVDGELEAMYIDGALNTATTTTEAVIKSAYILEDKEGQLVDSDSDAIYTATVDTDLDKFEFNVDGVAEGNYVLVVELRSMATATIADGDGLLDIEFDATTDGDVDEGTVYIINSI